MTGSAKAPTLSGNLALREGIIFVQHAVPDPDNGEEPTTEIAEIGLKSLTVKLQNDLSVRRL